MSLPGLGRKDRKRIDSNALDRGAPLRQMQKAARGVTGAALLTVLLKR